MLYKMAELPVVVAMTKEMSVRRMCCITGCGNRKDRPNSEDLMFYGFPNLPWQSAKRQQWIDLVRRKNPDGTPWNPSNRAFICSAHFAGNRKSEHPQHPSYLPTIFPPCYEDQPPPQPSGGKRKRKTSRLGNSPKRKSQHLPVITPLTLTNTTSNNGSSHADDTNKSGRGSPGKYPRSPKTSAENSLENEELDQSSSMDSFNDANVTTNSDADEVNEPPVTRTEPTISISISTNKVAEEQSTSAGTTVIITTKSKSDDRLSPSSDIVNNSTGHNDDDWDDDDRPSTSDDILPSALMEMEMVVDDDSLPGLNFEPEVCLMVDAATETDSVRTPSTTCDVGTSIGSDAGANANSFLVCQGFHGYGSIGNDAEMLDLTGVTRDTFAEILKRLAIPIRQWKLSKSNRLLAYLMKNKLGLSDTVLAVLFGVNRETISGIFLGYMVQFREATRSYLSLNSGKALPDAT